MGTKKVTKSKLIAEGPKMVRCPMCGEERESTDAHVYECPQCGGEGFDCCVAGNNCICVNCESEDE